MNTFLIGGKLVQYVVFGFDMIMLYVNVSGLNFLREIDFVIGELGGKIVVDVFYNLYWMFDGIWVIVMVEWLNCIDFYDCIMWKLFEWVIVLCKSKFKGFNFGGVNYVDWLVDGSYFLVMCEFVGKMLKVDTNSMVVIGELDFLGDWLVMF